MSSDSSDSNQQCNKNDSRIISPAISSSASSSSGDQHEFMPVMNPQHLTLSSLAMDASQVSSIKGPKERDNIETDRLQKRTGYELTQKNGQRIYGGPPPNWYGPPPVKGTEIFVGKVPRDMYEWQLVPIFERVILNLSFLFQFSCLNFLFDYSAVKSTS